MTLQSGPEDEQTIFDVVTHQHSGDPAMVRLVRGIGRLCVVTHQHSGDPAIEMKTLDLRLS